jgi:hypothetical protein
MFRVVREADLLLQPRPRGIAIDDDAELFLQLASAVIELEVEPRRRDTDGEPRYT